MILGHDLLSPYPSPEAMLGPGPWSKIRGSTLLEVDLAPEKISVGSDLLFEVFLRTAGGRGRRRDRTHTGRCRVLESIREDLLQTCGE